MLSSNNWYLQAQWKLLIVPCEFCRLLGPLEPEGCGRQRSWPCSLASAKTAPSSFLLILASRLPGNSRNGVGACDEAGMSEAFQALAPGETERHKWFWSCLNLQTHRFEAQSLVPFVEGLWYCFVSGGVCLILFWLRSLSASIPESDHPIGSCIHKPSILACFFLVTDEIVLFDMVNMQASQATEVPVSLNNGIWIKHSSPEWAAGSLLHPPIPWKPTEPPIRWELTHAVVFAFSKYFPTPIMCFCVLFSKPLPKPPPAPFLPGLHLCQNLPQHHSFLSSQVLRTTNKTSHGH